MTEDKQASLNLGTLEINRSLVGYLDKQLSALSLSVPKAMSNKEEKWGVLFPLIYCIVDSLDSFLILSQNQKRELPKVRDSYVIGRTLIESIINIIYILAKGDEAVQFAKNHYAQKSHRGLKRKLTVGDQKFSLEWMGKSTLKSDPETIKTLEEYTTKRGKEITSWTPDSIIKRLEIIQNKYGGHISSVLNFSFFTIYRDASEITHGTFYGAMDLFGLTSPREPNRGAKKILEDDRTRFSLLSFAILWPIHSLLLTLAKELSFPELKEVTQKIEKELKNEAWWKKMNEAI